ncbi:MAG: Ltp family lipoprotein [Candidatus Magasanikbacteria bacterium]|jgi:outer membrane biosynthesis protein TonB
MNNLFGLLFLVSLVCLVVGLIKPTAFSRFIKGELTRKRIGKIFGISAIALFVLVGITADSSKKNDNQIVKQPVAENTQNVLNNTTTTPAVEEKNKIEVSTPTPTKTETKTAPVKTQAPIPTPTPAPTQVKQEVVPTEYKSALNKATSYANTMHMSKRSVYDQLVSEYGEKFSAAAAQYAIDNVKADWNANALAKAKTYQNTMNMSPAGIRDQLTSAYGEKFTQSEADYAIQHLND